MSYLSNIGIALPGQPIAQESLLQYMIKAHHLEGKEATRLSQMYARSGIHYRHSVLQDFTRDTEQNFFSEKYDAPIELRMNKFFEEAPALALQAAKQTLQAQTPTHLITVSCTGMAAPGLDLLLLHNLQLPATLPRTSVNFMGCYAMFHALKMAHAICHATPNAKVLVVSVELCTLHFGLAQSTDQHAANLLFGDGATACLVSTEKPNTPYLKISNFYSKVIVSGNKDMAWRITGSNFLMTLSQYIPQLIEENIGALLNESLTSVGSNQKQIEHWAIHPGGRKILDHIQTALKLSQQDLWASYDVLKAMGNLSSATLLPVLNKVIQQNHYHPSQQVFAAGFGPGLTLETAIFNL